MLLDKSFMIRVYSSVFTGKNGIKSFIPVNSPFSAAFLFCNSKFSKVLFCGFDNSWICFFPKKLYAPETTANSSSLKFITRSFGSILLILATFSTLRFPFFTAGRTCSTYSPFVSKLWHISLTKDIAFSVFTNETISGTCSAGIFVLLTKSLAKFVNMIAPRLLHPPSNKPKVERIIGSICSFGKSFCAHISSINNFVSSGTAL